MATETLNPNADNYIQWTNSTGANHYTEVADDSDSTYVDTAGNYDADYLGLEDTSAASGQTINSVTVWSRGYTDGTLTVGEMRHGVRLNGSDYIEDCLYGGSWENLSYQWDLNPDDDESWESTDIDAAVRIIKTGNVEENVYVSKVWLVVDYVAAGGGESAQIGGVLAMTGSLTRKVMSKRALAGVL